MIVMRIWQNFNPVTLAIESVVNSEWWSIVNGESLEH